MSVGPLNGFVLGAAAVVSSPALWLSLVEGTLPLDAALTRYLISVALCWAGLNVLIQMTASRPAPQPLRAPEEAGSDQPAHGAGDPAKR